MLSSGLPPVLLVLSVLELSWSLSDEEKKIILDEHNKYRSQVSPPAMAMMKMTWDTDLEVAAQRHAEKCSWERNNGLTKKNLFATNSTLDVELAIEEWNGEKEFYNFSTSECDPGKTCDDYIQVIWAETNRIGCGSKFCKKVDGIEAENVQLLLCTYHPSSNIEEKMPYWEGPSCKRCPKGTVCVDNLCALPKLTATAKPEPTVPVHTKVKPEPTASEATITTAKPPFKNSLPATITAKPPPTTTLPNTAKPKAPTLSPITRAKSKSATSHPTTTPARPKPTTPKPTTTLAKPMSAAATSACATIKRQNRKLPQLLGQSKRPDRAEATRVTLSFEPMLGPSPEVEAGTGEPPGSSTKEDLL